ASGIEARTPASLDFFSGRAAAVGDSHFLALRKWPTTGRRNIARRCASAASWNGAESTARGAERADGGGCAKASIAEALAGSLTRQGTRSSATTRPPRVGADDRLSGGDRRRNLFAIFRSLMHVIIITFQRSY